MASRLPPGWDVEGLLRQLQPDAVGHVIGKGSEKGKLQVEEDRCREGQVSRELLSEHLGHAGTIGAMQVKCDVCLVGRYIMWLTTIESCAVDVHHSTTYGWTRGLFVSRLGS